MRPFESVKRPVKVPQPSKSLMKRLTIDVNPDLHRRIKVECAKRGVNMADELRHILEREFPRRAG